jgi:hypothetical protein
MAQDSTTSMTLTGVSSGLQMSMMGRAGTISIANTTVAGEVGYAIAEQLDKDKPYSVVTVAGRVDVVDPATVAASVYYTQEEGYDEVDLEARYTDIPNGTMLQVECSNATFNIPKQGIHGTSYVASIGRNVGPIEMSIAVKLWIPESASLKKTAELTLAVVKIESGSGPVKKTLLEKIAIHLVS